MLCIRPEAPADFEAIDDLLITAFAFDAHSIQNEARIVRALRESGSLTLGLVADSTEQGLAGMIAFSPVSISDGTPGWMGLGPVAVEPRLQRRGVGRQLMEAGLDAIRAAGAKGCVVLGEPAFYTRFGFSQTHGLELPDVDPFYFMAQRFAGPEPAGTVAYHPAFTTA